MVELYNIKKTFDGSRYVLEDLNFKIEKGEYVQIIGKSGSGKSSLLNIIGLLDRKYEGSVIVNGESTSKMSDTKISRIRSEKISFIFQAYNLINHLTAIENIYIPLLYSKRSIDNNYIKKINFLIEELNVEKIVNTKVQYLSGGEKQRISMIRALSLDSDIILADEPTGNLDYGNSQIVFNILKKQAKEGKTIILVTHNRHDNLGSDRIVALEGGVLK